MTSCLIIHGNPGNGKTYAAKILSTKFNVLNLSMDHVIDFISEYCRGKFGKRYPNFDSYKFFMHRIFKTKADFYSFQNDLDEIITKNEEYFREFYEKFVLQKKPASFRHNASHFEQKYCINLGENGNFLESFAEEIINIVFKYVVKKSPFFIVEGFYFRKGSKYTNELECHCKDVHHLGCFYTDIYECDGIGIKNIQGLEGKIWTMVKPHKKPIAKTITKSVKKTRRSYQSFSENAAGDSRSHEKLPKLGLPDDLKGKNVIDLGCNEGFFCYECEKRGAKVTGVERDSYWYDLALERKKKLSSSVNFVNIDWNFLHSLKQKFDIVLFLGAFHYSKDNQLELLTKIFNVLNDNGLLILEVGLLDKDKGKFLVENVKRPVGDICQYTNEFTIKKFLKDAGFNKVVFHGKGWNIQGDDVPRYIIHATKTVVNEHSSMGIKLNSDSKKKKINSLLNISKRLKKK